MQVERPLITARQFVILVFIGGIVIKGLMLPSALLRVSGKDGLFVMLAYFAVETLNVGIFAYLIKTYPDKTFFDVIRDCFGSVISRIIAIVIIVAATIKFTLNLSEVKAFFALGMFASLNWAIMIVPLLVLCFVFAIKSLRILGRTAEVFFPFILVCIALLSLVLFREVPLENVLPLWEHGVEPVKKGIMEFPVWFGDVIVMVVAMGNVKKSKRLMTMSIVARALSSALIISFSVALFSSYGNIIPLVKYGHNITSLTQYNLGSQEYGRFDLIIYSVWMSGVFLKMAMNCYLVVRLTSYLVKCDNCKYIALALAAVYYLMSVVIFPTTDGAYMLSTSAWAKIVFSFAEYLLPIILLIAAKLRYKKGVSGKKQSAEEEYAKQQT